MIVKKKYIPNLSNKLIFFLFSCQFYFSNAQALDTQSQPQLETAAIKRNPFAPTEKILTSMVSTYTDNGRSAFVSSGALTRLPPLKLRGVVKPDDDNSVVALLEVGGSGKQIHMVKIGDEIAFDRNDPSLVFKIRAIDRLSVIVEVGTLGDVIIVR
jgi:hypothetical protein|tara:strand:- start:142 stop:609 length:468 start_codon:yes stop_codon:yes gene_type:complete